LQSGANEERGVGLTPQKSSPQSDRRDFPSCRSQAEHAARIVRLPPIHKDPFDRMLVAQAAAEPMILLTNDAVLSSYGTFVQIA
jgi:PIN domain nuclease of toxin-antitoxin system